MDVAFLITTHGRKESCQRLVDSLFHLGSVVVAIDGDSYGIDNALNLNPRIHHGKAGYWRLVNMLFRNRPQSKYYIMLPDDFIISETQVMEAIEIWEKIKDPQKICLSIGEGRPNNTCWTGFKAEEKEHVWLTQWVDGCFICEERLFTELGVIPRLHPLSKQFRGSSGVGAYMSRCLKKKKLNMYQVKEPLAIPTEEHFTSQMHT